VGGKAQWPGCIKQGGTASRDFCTSIWLAAFERPMGARRSTTKEGAALAERRQAPPRLITGHTLEGIPPTRPTRAARLKTCAVLAYV
jgi:hypothetical protein